MHLRSAQAAAMGAAPIPSTPPSKLRRRRVEFPSKEEGVKLVGELVWPAQRSSIPSTSSTSTSTSSSSFRVPVSVLAHGLADDRDSFVLPRLAEELAARAGVASLRFDFRGSGESGGEFNFGNAATADGDPADLEAAVEFLNGFSSRAEEEDDEDCDKEQPLLLFEVVALLGHSKAGSAVVSYAARRGGGGGKGEEGEAKAKAREERDPLFVPLIINVAGRFDHADPRAITSRFGDDIFERVRELEAEGGVPLTWRAGKNKKPLAWRLTAADLEDRLSTDMGALCRRLPPATRLLCVHGTEDATVPPSAAERYREAAAGEAEAGEAEAGEAGAKTSRPPLLSPPRVVMVQGGDHNFTQRAKADELVDAVVDFISEGLRR